MKHDLLSHAFFMRERSECNGKKGMEYHAE